MGNIEESDIALIAKYLGNLPTTKAKPENWKKLKDYDYKGTPRGTAYKGTDNQGIMLMSGTTKGYKHSPKNAEIIDQLSACMEITALEIIREKMGGTYSPTAPASMSATAVCPNRKLIGPSTSTAILIAPSSLRTPPSRF